MAAGLDPDAFWRLTPRLYLTHMNGVRKRLDREAREMSWAVWHVAALTRAQKMPRLNQFVPSGRQAVPAATTWQAQLQQWQVYADRKKAVCPGSGHGSADDLWGR